MIDVEEYPKARPFAAHGVEFKRLVGKELIADCPFSGKEDKFYLNAETGAWHSKTAGVGGGVSKFLGMMQDQYREPKELPQKLAALAKHRQMPKDAFKDWSIGWDGTHYTFVIRDDSGRAVDIRRYDPERKTMRSTAGCTLGLMGAHKLKDRPNEPVYLCEGEWDAIAMNWLLRSLDKPGVAVGLPGAASFKPEWVEWLKGRNVHTLYDHDEAGEKGEEVAQKRLNGTARSITYTHWPTELPKGFDTRDWIVYGAVDRQTPEPCFDKLTHLFKPGLRRGLPQPQKEVILFDAQGRRMRVNNSKIIEPPKKKVTLAQVHDVFRKWLHSPNLDAVDVMLATCWSQQIEGPPLWMFLVAPPGGAKTVTLLSLKDWQKAFLTSSLTPHSLISGANFNGAKDPSLIPRLNGLILVVKDFTPVFSMRDLDQGEIFGILRDAYDGRCGKQFGNGVERHYESRFSIIAGVTPRIHDLGEGHASLGERFLKFSMGDNLTHASEAEQIARAIDNVDSDQAMQTELAEVVAAFLDGERGPLPTISEAYVIRLIALARFGARIRGTVTKDFRGENIIGKPFAEVATRLGIQLSKMCRSLAWIRGKTEVGEEEYRIAVKVMLDTVTQRSEDVIRAIYRATPKHDDRVTSHELATITQYPNSTIKRMLDDLVMLQVLQRKGTQFRFSWRLSDYILEQIRMSELYKTPAELTRKAAVVFKLRRRRQEPEGEN